MLRLVLPKGSLERATFELFESADLAVSRSSAVDYQATIDDPEVGPFVEDFPIPVGRRGTVDDIAEAVWFVLEATFMVGAVMFVDGGSDALMRPDVV